MSCYLLLLLYTDQCITYIYIYTFPKQRCAQAFLTKHLEQITYNRSDKS